MSKQPEALILAKWLDLGDDQYDRRSAKEMRRLHEVENKYHESVGGFKRDLVEKLEQQRNKNKRLHEVNTELLEALKCILYVTRNIGSAHFIARAAIPKAEGELNEP